MPFGKRRFSGNLVHNGTEWCARFLPFDFGADPEVVPERQLIRELRDNDVEAEPLPAAEEEAALLALDKRAERKPTRPKPKVKEPA